MITEELKEFIQSLIKEQLNIYSKRMITIETMLNFYQQEQKSQNSAIAQQLKNLQRQFSQFLNEIKEAKTAAGQILQKTEKKLKDIEKVKLNQENQLKDQKKQRNMQKDINCIEKNQELNQTLANTQQLSKQEENQSSSQLCSINKLSQNIISNQVVFKSTTGTKFHRINCRWLEHSSNPVDRNNPESMKGLVACLVCKP